MSGVSPCRFHVSCEILTKLEGKAGSPTLALHYVSCEGMFRKIAKGIKRKPHPTWRQLNIISQVQVKEVAQFYRLLKCYKHRVP